MGPQGIVTKLFQKDEMRRGGPPHGNAPPSTSRPRRPDGQRDFERYLAFWRFILRFSSSETQLISGHILISLTHLNTDSLLPSLGQTVWPTAPGWVLPLT
jgi:hypothetical protein